MKCLICKVGETEPGRASIYFEDGGKGILVEDVPAHVCNACGEARLDAAVAENVRHSAEAAWDSGLRIEAIQYAAIGQA